MSLLFVIRITINPARHQKAEARDFVSESLAEPSDSAHGLVDGWISAPRVFDRHQDSPNASLNGCLVSAIAPIVTLKFS